MRRFLHALFLVSALHARAVDQTGAESRKMPASARIIPSSGSSAEGPQIGNAEVTYTDGTKDQWTTKGNCSLARVASDGTVGWTVHGPPQNVAASYTMRPNGKLVLNRRGKVIAQITSSKAFIEDWMFIENGSRLVLLSRGAHGPANIELHDTASGNLLQLVAAYAQDLPAWAKPFQEK